jgi:hypothetical protein
MLAIFQFPVSGIYGWSCEKKGGKKKIKLGCEKYVWRVTMY